MQIEIETATAVSIFTFCAGTLFGHRLALWRDKRNDFNRIAQPLREILMRERSMLSTTREGLSLIDADRIEHVLPRNQRKRFRADWEAYKDAKSQQYQDPLGQPFYKNHELILSKIDGLLAYTEPR